MKKRFIFIALGVIFTPSLGLFAGCDNQGDSFGFDANLTNSSNFSNLFYR